MGQIPAYTDKLGLGKHLGSLGISVNWLKDDDDGGYYVDDGREQQTIDETAAYDELPAWKTQKRDEVKAEGLTRINAVFPALDSLDEIQLVAEQWLSIAPAARQPTADFQRAIDIYSAAKAGVAAVNGMDLAGVQAYNPVTDPAWP